MFGLDIDVIQKELAKLTKMAEDTNKLTVEIKKLNGFMPELIAELKRLNNTTQKP